MNITQERNENRLTLSIEGRIDTKTAPELEQVIRTDLTIDLEQTVYISSAGLRVLLIAQKQMNRQGSMRIIHANADLAEIFEVTGFNEILTIE